MVEMDVAPTRDGRIAIFHDPTLDCKTDGHGDVRARTLPELKALDVGYGYSADQRKSFPLRGSRRDSIPSLEEAIAALPNTPILFNFKSDDPAEADRLFAALTADRRRVEELGDAFYGPPAPAARMKQHYPGSWSSSWEAAKKCTKEYVLIGWTGHVPESCREGMIVVPVNRQWLFWGWPNRLAARMEAVHAKVVVTGRYHPGLPNAGLNLPEQLGEVPSTFKGYIWVEDIWTIGPALRPNRDIRTEAQQQLADRGLARRRKLGR
jgi:glycerophosphoryl diester phosphodiesterase